MATKKAQGRRVVNQHQCDIIQVVKTKNEYMKAINYQEQVNTEIQLRRSKVEKNEKISRTRW